MPNAKVLNNLKQKRIQSNMTQENLARLCGVTRQTIIAIEKGNYSPSVLLALKLARNLNCSVEELFYEETV